MLREEAEELVGEALSRLASEQPELFRLDIAERALTHHLANCIAARVGPHLSVDVEYNRNHADPKRLNLPSRSATDRELRATTVFPDVIVHVRGNDDSNLLVLEVKKRGESLGYDEIKLRAFRGELKYRHAAHVVVGVDEGRPVHQVIWIDKEGFAG